MDKYLETMNTYVSCSIIFFPESREVYEIMWKKCGAVGQSIDDNIMRGMRFAR